MTASAKTGTCCYCGSSIVEGKKAQRWRRRLVEKGSLEELYECPAGVNQTAWRKHEPY